MDSSKIRQALRRGVWLGIGTVVCIVLIVGILYQQLPLQEKLDQTVAEVNYHELFLGWLCMILAVFVLGFRYKALLPAHPKLSGWFLGACLSGGLLLNYAIPGPFGELVGAYFVHKKADISVSLGTAAAVVARMLGLLTAAVGALFCYLFLPTMKVAFVMQFLMLGIGAGVVLLLLIFLLPRYIPHTGKGIIASLAEACVTLAGLPKVQYAKAVFWSIVGHLLAYAGVVLSLDSLGNVGQLLGVLFSYLTGTCCGTIAFLFPGSQFTWDAMFASLLVASSSYTIEAATIGVLVLRVEQVAMMAFGAIPLMILMKRITFDSKEQAEGQDG